MAKKKTKPVEEQVELEIPAVETETVAEEPATGIVANCQKLNVRSEPKATADIVYILDAKAEVEIAGEFGDFYKVSTKKGVSGFCMKKFIKTS